MTYLKDRKKIHRCLKTIIIIPQIQRLRCLIFLSDHNGFPDYEYIKPGHLLYYQPGYLVQAKAMIKTAIKFKSGRIITKQVHT